MSSAANLKHSLTWSLAGASPVSREVQKRLCEIFPTAQIGQAYGNVEMKFIVLCLLTTKDLGLTEMTTTLAMVSATQKQGPLGSKSNRYHLALYLIYFTGGGRLLPGIQAQVIKSDGSPARFGERGELVVKGPGKALGYFGNLQA